MVVPESMCIVSCLGESAIVANKICNDPRLISPFLTEYDSTPVGDSSNQRLAHPM